MNAGSMILLYLLNGVVGSGIGYGIAVLLLKRLTAMDEEEGVKGDYRDPYWGHVESEKDEPVISKSPGVVERDPVDYTAFTKKGDLRELAQKYKPEDKAMYVIMSEEMRNDETNQNETETLYFYNDDSVWTDDQDNSVNSLELVGPNVHLHFGEQSGDSDIVFIRNEVDAVDYECVRLHKSYAVEILGEEPQPKKTPRKKSKKQVTDEDQDPD